MVQTLSRWLQGFSCPLQWLRNGGGLGKVYQRQWNAQGCNVSDRTEFGQKNALIESDSWCCQSHPSRPASVVILSNKGTPGVSRRPNGKMSSKLSSRSSSTLAISP